MGALFCLTLARVEMPTSVTRSTEFADASGKKKVKSTDATPRQPVKIRASGNLAGK